MKVTIVGYGNIGTLMAAEMAYRGHSVTVYTSSVPDSNTIEVYDQSENCILSGKMDLITDNLEEAVKGAEVIWITLPSQMFEEFAERLYSYIEPKQIIGVVPGSGGAEFAFRKLIAKGCIMVGLQRVHSIARIKERGKSVYMLGKKDELQVGVIPKEQTEKMTEMVRHLFDMPCVMLDNYLCVTLTPSNPILHTARLYTMFKDFKKEESYPRNFLFYEEWNDESSDMLLKCDAELQNLCGKIPMELSDVKSLKLHYESNTPQKMSEKIRSIGAFKGITSPMVCIGEDRWIPDFSSRYFTSDFPYGLKIILELCRLFAVDAPNIQMVWDWYTKQNTEAKCFETDLTKDELLKLYV